MADDRHWTNTPAFYAAMTVVALANAGFLVATGAGELLVVASLGLAGFLVYRTLQAAGEGE